MKLFIFFIGLPGSFSVTLERSETVGDLKERILKKSPNVLKGVDAGQLTLYKVQLPDNETLGQSAFHADKRMLFSYELVSGIFPTDPPVGTVSILIEFLDIGE